VSVYTAAQVAERWKCSAGVVRKMIDRGELMASRDSAKRMLIKLVNLEEYERGDPQGSTEKEAADEREELVILVGTVNASRARLPTVQIEEPVAARRFGEARHIPHLTYIVRSGGFVKIGTTSDLHVRFRALVAMNPHDVEMVAALAGGQSVERALHQRFAAYRHRDEWFREEGELAAWIAGGCQADGGSP
jgi:hypothetical protein